MYRYIRGIPNTVEFRLKDKIIDNFALAVYGILRNQESRFVKVQGTKRLEKSNKYLDHQFRRLEKYAKTGQLEKFNYLARVMMMKSKVYGYYAMKFVFPKLLRMNTVKAVNLWRRTKALRLSESSDLKYKRVWITDPGKSEEYTRPLGVPTAEWRVYGHMLTKIMEVYLNGRGYLTRNQHGGKAKFGVMSFLRSLAIELERARCLLEFDIKGFFNNVSHESMLKLIEGCYLKEQMSKILKCKPESYTLNPPEEDDALRRYKKSLEFDYKKIGTEIWYELGLLELYDEDWKRDNPGLVMHSRTYLIVDTESSEYYLKNGSTESERLAVPRESSENRITLENSYSLLKNGGLIMPDTFWNERDFNPDELARAKGRDNWKGLGKDGCGVPQGTAFGPLLASTVLGYNLRNLKSLIYMDDGILIGRDEKDCNRLKTILTNKLKRIGCEIAPEKTNVLDGRALVTAGVKLLGTRWTRVRNLFSQSVKSETRRGITRPLINVRTEHLKNLVDRMYEAGLMSFSKNQVFWREIGSKYVRELLDEILLGVAVRHEIFGSILAKAYSPESSIAEMVREIQYGIFKAEAKLAKYPWNTIEKRLYRKYQARYMSEEGKICTTRVTLQNVSTLSNDIFLAFINKDLPVRSKLNYNFYPLKVRKAVVKRIKNSGLRFR